MTELNVIAAAVIGGTSLAGGIGTIYGAVARRGVHAEPRERHGAPRRAHADAEDGHRHRPRSRAVWIDHGLPAEPPMTPPLVELRRISQDLRRRARGRGRRRRPVSGRGRRPARPQRRRQVDADQGPVRRLPARPAARSAWTASRCRSDTTRDAKALGIETIYQNLALAENLDAVANLFLGREVHGRFGFLDEETMEHEARRTLDRMKLRLPSLRNLVSRSPAASARPSPSVAPSISTPGS